MTNGDEMERVPATWRVRVIQRGHALEGRVGRIVKVLDHWSCLFLPLPTRRDPDPGSSVISRVATAPV